MNRTEHRQKLRRDNFTKIKAKRFKTNAALSDALGEEFAPSYISQLLGGHRGIGDAVADKIEARLRLPSGYLDSENAEVEVEAPPVTFNVEQAELVPIRRKQLKQVSVGEVGMNAKENRLYNLRLLINTRFNGNAGKCADFLGLKRPQMHRWVTANEAARQGVSEESARAIEHDLGLPRGWLDGDESAEKAGLGAMESELLQAWAYLLPAEKEAIMEQIRPMAAHNKAVLEHHSKP